MQEKYAVGYKKPPVKYRFQKGNSAGRKADRKDELPDLVGHLERPLKAERGGKIVNIHPFEAATLAVVKDALKGKPRSIKKAIETFEKAGLLEPPPGKQTHGVLTIPKNMSQSAFLLFFKVLGVPPWDPKLLEAAKAEYAEDDAELAELRRQFLEGSDHV